MTADNIEDRITLRDGNTIPIFGLGCFNMKDGDIEIAVGVAVENGYRLFDTAVLYGNEKEVAKALRGSALKREEYFIVTKLPTSLHGYDEAKRSLKNSLKLMKLDYVDLYLIHGPSTYEKVPQTWRAFTELKAAGLTKSIGVSNFNVQHLRPLIEHGYEIPVVNQIEMHPWNQYREAISFCKEHEIAVMGYCPLARGRAFSLGFSPVIESIAKKYNKSKSQILLRWAVQKNVITIPKSATPSRIAENCQLFDWRLSTDDAKLIDGLDEGLEISCACSHMKMQPDLSGII